VVGAVLVFRDVSEDYAAQQALRDSAALVAAILNTVVDGIITLHSHGGIVETVNPAAEQMFGYSAADLIGQDFGMLIPELARGQQQASLEDYLASDAARAIGRGREVIGRRKDGSLFPLEIAASEMWLGGQRYFHRHPARHYRAQAGRSGSAEGRRPCRARFRTAPISRASPPTPAASSRSSMSAPNACWATRPPT
jgi:PAS domain S-box-containing protein